MWPFNKKKKAKKFSELKYSAPPAPAHPDDGNTLLNYMVLDSMTHHHHTPEPDPVKHDLPSGGHFGGGGSSDSFDSGSSHSYSDSGSSYDSGSSDSYSSDSSSFSSND